MTQTNPRTSPHLRPHTADLNRLLAGEHHDPHSILGAHEYTDQTVIRAYRPHAVEVAAVVGGERYVFQHIEAGLFAVALPFTNLVDYRLQVSYDTGGESPHVHNVADAYRFLPTLGEVDLHLFAEGRHERLWEILGAHPRSFTTPDGVVDGVSFAVWAPNAKGVSLIGEFNHWDGNEAQLRVLGSTGVWELFWPGFEIGGLYKFRVYGADGSVTDRADPMAFATEVPPQTASKVTKSSYTWDDADWMTQRATQNPVFEPMSTYEVHLMSWRPGLSYHQLAKQLTEYVVDQGFTHVELMPVAEHPFGGSWGYQVTSYYAPTSRLGTPDEFRFLVDRLHQAGIGVIMDWVPAHFPKDSWALGRFDGTPLYEHSDPHRGEQLDWGTYVFDFGRAEVRNFLVANALYWLQEFHIDGLRVDAVASMLYLDYSRAHGEWIPNQYGGRENLEAVDFIQRLNTVTHGRMPGTITVQSAWMPTSMSTRRPSPTGKKRDMTIVVTAAATIPVATVTRWARTAALTKPRRVMPIARNTKASSPMRLADRVNACDTSSPPANATTMPSNKSAACSTASVVSTRRLTACRSRTGVPGARSSFTSRCSAAMSWAPLVNCTSAFSISGTWSPYCAWYPGETKI